MTLELHTATILLLLSFTGTARAVPTENTSLEPGGTPFLSTYRCQDYDTHPQNWATVQDSRRVMYFGNTEGVLEFDGINWRPAEATFELTVLPPWYRTIYFRLAVLLTVAAALWLIYRRLTARALRIHREISEQERAIERERLIDLLKQQNAELESFSYTISHDLKSPLLTIKGFVGMLRRDIGRGSAERIDEDMDRIETAAEKMAMLLEDLLELSRVGQQTHPHEDVALEELAREAQELVSEELRQRDVALVIADDLPTVNVDRARIITLLQNLLQNAARYMGDQADPRIVIGMRQNGRGPVFFVRDNGMGIDSRYRAKIFGLFERLDVSTPGTGIGLALAKRIVEAHGGQIWVESDGPGTGSTFHFTLSGVAPNPAAATSGQTRRSKEPVKNQILANATPESP